MENLRVPVIVDNPDGSSQQILIPLLPDGKLDLTRDAEGNLAQSLDERTRMNMGADTAQEAAAKTQSPG